MLLVHSPKWLRHHSFELEQNIVVGNVTLADYFAHPLDKNTQEAFTKLLDIQLTWAHTAAPGPVCLILGGGGGMGGG